MLEKAMWVFILLCYWCREGTANIYLSDKVYGLKSAALIKPEFIFSTFLKVKKERKKEKFLSLSLELQAVFGVAFPFAHLRRHITSWSVTKQFAG